MRFLGLYLSWIISILALLGSLFFQYSGGIEPNTLSWYQRVCMDPLVILLAVASFKQFYRIIFYVLPQVIIGGLFAIFQIIFRVWPKGRPIETCGADADCMEPVLIAPQTLPVLSLFGFVAIFILLIWCWKRNRFNSKVND